MKSECQECGVSADDINALTDEVDRLRALLERAVFILTDIDGAHSFCRDARAALSKAQSSPDTETKR